jgi:predicted PurR-regulated permease PerM
LVVVSIAFVLWLCLQLSSIIVDAIIAITLAAAIMPLAAKAESRRIPRAATVLLTYLTVVLFYTGIGWALWNPISTEVNALKQNFPAMQTKVEDWYFTTANRFGLPQDLTHNNEVQQFAKAALHRTMNVSLGLMGVIGNVVLVLFLTSYFVINSKRMSAALLQWVPLRHRAKAEALMGPVANRMGGYVRGQALVSTAVGAFFAIGFSLIQLKYALVLGVLAGVLNLIPFVGSITATILAVFVALTDAYNPLLRVVLTIGLFVVEQTIESNFIVPFLLGSQVELDPLIVLIAILIGATLGGAVGALIAVPIASALLLIAQELYLKPMHEQEAVSTTLKA